MQSHISTQRRISSDSQIHNATGIDVKKFTEHVTNVQDMVTKKTAEKFSGFSGQVDMYLAEIGGDA